jgi:branched-chain amino acid transport system ATP-binding protein
MSLEVRGLCKSFGALAVTQDVALDVPAPGLHALIGPNGAGKTSLIHQLMGTLTPDAGQIRLDGRDITRLAPHRRARLGLARTFQITQLVPAFTAAENVALAVQARSRHPLRAWGRAGQGGVEGFLAAVGLAGRAGVLAQELSHGERRALEIAAALALEPRCILLDEPLAGMGHEEAQGIVALLHALKARFGLLLVEHDMDAVFALADRVSVLVSGAVIASGTPEQVRADPAVRTAYLGDEC